MGYYKIIQTTDVKQSEPAKKTADDWFEILVTEGPSSGDALVHLIHHQAEAHLLAALHCPNKRVTESAAYGLMECWISECGLSARENLQRGIEAYENDDFDRAEAVFTALMESHSDWSEPLHHLGTLRYVQGKPNEAIELHQNAIRLKPHHFGAWHGIALNAVEIQDWPLALEAADQALSICPGCRSSMAIVTLAETALKTWA